MSQIYEKSIQELKSLFLKTFENDDARILLFGSRARGDCSGVSDIDIGILPSGDFDHRKLIFLKERVENLNIPYTVDIVDLSKVSNSFREKALREGIVWKT